MPPFLRCTLWNGSNTSTAMSLRLVEHRRKVAAPPLLASYHSRARRRSSCRGEVPRHCRHLAPARGGREVAAPWGGVTPPSSSSSHARRRRSPRRREVSRHRRHPTPTRGGREVHHGGGIWAGEEVDDPTMARSTTEAATTSALAAARSTMEAPPTAASLAPLQQSPRPR
jgi:hypothetical protein